MFLEVALVLAVAAILGAAALLLRQPLVVAFLAAGILVGPVALGLVHDEEPFELLAELGIVLLLLWVGMKLDPRMLRELGPVALVTGTLQVVATSALGFALAHLVFGFSLLTSIYLGVAFSFSSTIVIAKLLSDKQDAETLHGRLAIGLLIVQDIWVIVVLVALSLLPGGAEGGIVGDGSLLAQVAVLLGVGAGILLGVYLLMRFVFPPLIERIASSRELLVLFAVAWGVSLAAACAWAGLSAELGGFVAGVALAESRYRDVLGSRIVPVRDFLLLFFFVVLGAGMDLSLIAVLALPVIVFSLFVFVLKPLLVLGVFGWAGFRMRPNFLTASMMGQTSEFGLVLGAMGLALGHIDAEAMGLITLVSLVTIAASTYVIMANEGLYRISRPVLGVFERSTRRREETRGEAQQAQRDVVLYGLGRFGSAIADALQKAGHRVLAVDLDPRVVEAARRAGVKAMYGDAEDAEFPAHLPLAQARLVVSAIANVTANRVLARGLHEAGYRGPFIVTAHRDVEASRLEAQGFEVLRPFREAGDLAAAAILERLRAAGGEDGGSVEGER